MPKILIIDDDLISAKVIADHLYSENYKVDVFQDAEQGWQQFLRHPNDYVILLIDRIMPKLHAIQFLQRMHLHQLHTPVIVMTGEADEFEQKEIIAAGASALIFKPVDKKNLISLIQEAK